MKYLLDTHVALWYLEQSPRLSKNIEQTIDDAENDIFVCAISLWEVAIKVNLGKLDLRLTLAELFELVEIRNFRIIPIEYKHMLTLLNLPYHHKDPFDRLIIATALAEQLTIISADKNIQRYDVPWIW
ncbi:MAG: type II toxin-antitoxin system VapC family toxin [Turicibacter sp.]|nr:type II toxin-antitoxin system VapC family toxin [Turicibacter sp.]